MSNQCPTTPYSNQEKPYSDKVSPLSSIHNIFSDKQTPYSSISSPIQDKFFCPTGFFMLIDDIHYLNIDGFDNKVKI